MERLKRIEDWIGENAVMIGSAVLVLIALWCVPSFHLKRWDLPKATPQEKFLLENESRKTLAQVLIGLFGLYALLLTFRRTRAQEKATEIAEQGHITDRFTKAVEQLGKMDDQKPNIPVRLGAIYALERIARDSERDHWPIMEILTAYVRQEARLDPDGDGPRDSKVAIPRTDIQAILDVLGRRQAARERNGQRLDLRRSDLHGLELRNGNFENAIFNKASLQDAVIFQSNLSGALLIETRLDRAKIFESSLVKAYLHAASLKQAQAHGDFTDADLGNAMLQGANLSQATGLSAQQVQCSPTWMLAAYSNELRDELGLNPNR